MSKQHAANPGQTNERVETTGNEFFAEEGHKTPGVALRTRRRPILGAKRLPKSPAPNVSQLVAAVFDFVQRRVPQDLHQVPRCSPSPYIHIPLVTVFRIEYSFYLLLCVSQRLYHYRLGLLWTIRCCATVGKGKVRQTVRRLLRFCAASKVSINVWMAITTEDR